MCFKKSFTVNFKATSETEKAYIVWPLVDDVLQLGWIAVSDALRIHLYHSPQPWP